MNCPIENRESAEILLAYCARKLDAGSSAILEEHIKICPACREFAEGQQSVWKALDAWEAAPVSPDFDRRLYARICLLYTSPSPRDGATSRMPSSA